MLIICETHIHPAVKEEEGEQVQKEATRIKQRSLWVKVHRMCRDLILIFSSESLAVVAAAVDLVVTTVVCLWQELKLSRVCESCQEREPSRAKSVKSKSRQEHKRG